MLTSEDHAFLTGTFSQLDGWCHVEAAALTLYLQRYQKMQGWSAPNFEIGVYKGKYLSVLQRSAADMGQRTTGIDIFMFMGSAKKAVEESLALVLGDCSNLTLVEKSSATYTPETLRAEVGGDASWISVDGDHTAAGVMHDLALAEAVLAPWGVIAIDDFVNANAIGVAEGAVRYLSSPQTNLRPFCFCANKLLVCAKEWQSTYHSLVPTFCTENSQYPLTQRFMTRYSSGAFTWCAPHLLGHDIWLII